MASVVLTAFAVVLVLACLAELAFTLISGKPSRIKEAPGEYFKDGS